MASRIRLEREVDPKYLEKAKTELRETPEVREAALKELRELVENSTEIYYDTRDEILTRYLRPTKYYAKSAYDLMVREAKFKADHAEYLKDLVPEMLKKIMSDKIPPVNVLVDRDQDGRRVLIQNCGKLWDTKEITSYQIFQIFYLIHQAAVLEPNTQINGVVVLLDFKGMGMSQVTSLTPKFALLLLTFIQKAIPLRMKQVHIVNEPLIFKMVWAIFKPLIEEKLNKRLWFHGSNMSNLHKYMSPDFLPSNYGGKLPEIDYSGKDWFPVLESVTETIKENNTFGRKKK